MSSGNKTLEELFAEHFSAEELQEIEACADELLIEVRLGEVRRALRRTQEEVAETLDRNQSAIAALENRSDMLVSTLRRYVEALGGELEIAARFPGRPKVRLNL